MPLCAWCREFVRGQSESVDHFTLHPGCAEQYRAWCRELKRLCDDEIARSKRKES